MADAPRVVDVLASDVGLVIGTGGATIRRLSQATGCRIEVPKHGGHADDGKVAVHLSGGPEQRRRAAEAIVAIVSGADVADQLGRAEGAMVVPHDLQNFDRESWARWRLVPTECQHNVQVEMGRNAVRIFSKVGALGGGAASAVRSEVDVALASARELAELTVDCRMELEPENMSVEEVVGPLVDQYGVLVRVPRPEGGAIPVRVVGPPDVAADAAALLEARFAKGSATACVMQTPGQLQALEGPAAADFQADLKQLEAEFSVQLRVGRVSLCLSGAAAEAIAEAKKMLREMLQFYFPDSWTLRSGLPHGAIKRLRADPKLRLLAAGPGCAVSFDGQEGSAWLAGSAKAAALARIEELVAKWREENWEMELEDYATAMWLLGPAGSGDYLFRMQAESGAKIRVDPVRGRVSAEGEPKCVKAAEAQVREALKRLEEKKLRDADRQPVAKKTLSDHPPHMQAVLEKLAQLDAEKVDALKKKRIRERELEWARERQEWGLEPTAVPAAAAAPAAAPLASSGASPDAPQECTGERAPPGRDASARWRVCFESGACCGDAIVRAGCDVGSERVALLRCGDVVRQTGPASSRGGILRVPIATRSSGDLGAVVGWMTASAAAVGGPTFLERLE